MQKKTAISVLVISMANLISCQSGVTGTNNPPTNISCTNIGVENVEQCTLTLSESSTVYGFNNLPYALCSETLCTLNESNSLASCVCPLINESGWQSASLSPNSYGSTQPTYNNLGILQSVQSNYSQANYPPPIQHCTFNTPHPWASCFGVRCSVTENRESALCSCPVNYTTEFEMEIPSSECNTQPDKVWSAAPADGNGYNEMQEIYQVLYPDAPVLINNNLTFFNKLTKKLN